jgi:hypothetical protein
MKKIKVMVLSLLVVMLVSSMSAATVFGAEATVKEIQLVSEDSGFKILISGYIEEKTVEVDNFGEMAEVKVIVMKAPQKDSNGNYPLFDIVTTNKSAHTVNSFPGIYGEGQAGSFEDGKFTDGRITYAPSFSLRKELHEFPDTVFMVDFHVYDKDFKSVFSSDGLNLMFVGQAESTNVSETTTETPTETTTETTAPTVASAKPTSSKVAVDGKEVAFEAYNIDGSNYFKLRDLAMVVNGTDRQFQVGWDAEKNAIDLTTGESYTSDGKELTVSTNLTTKEAKATSSTIYLNGEEVKFTAYNIGGNNYFKLRDIAEAIDFAVTWDAELSLVGIDTSAGYTRPE